MQNTELIVLGTGNATVTRCYNTCFALKQNNAVLLVDAGGGNGILSQLEFLRKCVCSGVQNHSIADLTQESDTIAYL